MSSPLPVLDIPNYLASPGALLIEDSHGKLKLPKFLRVIEDHLLLVAAGKISRLMINVPFQHGKTTLCTKYFLSWWLMSFPNTRVLLGAHETSYAKQKGADVRDVINEWGGRVGIRLKEDTQAKDEWKLDMFDGGMVSRGMKGSIQGRPGDLLVIEDPYKDENDYLSVPSNEQKWSWYTKVAYTRLSPNAPIIVVSTPWGKDDLCARIKKHAKETDEPWTVISFKAIAEEDDPLGRQPGEALWEERVPLRKLKIMQKMSPSWFKVCYQMHDGSGEGKWFKIKDDNEHFLWPTFRDLGSEAYSLERRGSPFRKIYSRDELIIYIVLDWAYGKKKWADYTAMGAFGLTPGGDMMVLEVVHHRFGLHELAPAIAEFCRRWHPHMVAAEQGHPTLRDECHAYHEIPEMRWLSHRNLSKLQRALQAITMGENGRILLPDDPTPWLDDYVAQMMSFTGLDDVHEDMVDMTAYAANLALEMRGRPAPGFGDGPCILTMGREWA